MANGEVSGVNTPTNLIYRGDCYSVLKRQFPDNCIDLIYVDPPFSFDPKYARLWYDKETLEMFEEMRKGEVKYYIAWMSKRLEQFHRVLKKTGSMYLHCDWKFGHYIKVEMDNIFGRNNFQNEIVWCYRGGGVSEKAFARKHDTIFFYSKTESSKRVFNVQYVPYSEASRKLVESRGGVSIDGKERALKRGAHMPDWWTDIISLQTWSPERIGYKTQKPLPLLERIIKASSNPNDLVLDPMCGCGTTLVVAHKLRRKWIGIDISSQACEVMRERMGKLEGIVEVPVIGLPLTTKDLRELGHFEFQDYICEMTNSVKTQHVADGGIDGYHLGENPLQIKQQEGVGRNTVDNFETALRRKGKSVGYIIAFSFTRTAYEEAARATQQEGLKIRLVDVSGLISRDYELEEKEE